MPIGMPKDIRSTKKQYKQLFISNINNQQDYRQLRLFTKYRDRFAHKLRFNGIP